MILRKCRIENPASSAAVGMSKNIFVRAGLAVGVSVNIILFPPFRRVSCIWLSNARTPSERVMRGRKPKTKYLVTKGLPGLPFFRRMNVGLCQEAENKKLTNKKLTNIGRGAAPSRPRDFLLRKMQQTTLSSGKGTGKGHRSAQDLRPSWGAAGCAAGAVLSRGQIAYNETCEELHRKHAQGRVALAY